MVTCGPGLTQCGTSLIAAYRGKTPMVVIAGQIAEGRRTRPVHGPAPLCRSVQRAVFTVSSIDNMAEEIAEAFYAARLNRVPVVLNLPMDLQETSSTGITSIVPRRLHAAARRNAKPGAAGAGDREAYRGGASGDRRRTGRSRIGRAGRDHPSGRPGGGAARTSLQGKGFFAGDPWDLGIAAPSRLPPPNTCWPRRISCWGSARSLATTRPRVGCCSPRPR